MSYAPPTVTPPPRPLGPMRGMLAVLRNPLDFWSADMYAGELSALQAGRHRFWTASGAQAAQAVLLDDAASFRKSGLVLRMLRPALGNGLLTAEGEDWRRQRRAAAPLFRHERLTALIPDMARTGEALADRLAYQPGEVDIGHQMVLVTLDLIVAAMFGARDYNREGVSADISTYLDTHGRIGLADYLGLPEWFPRRRWLGRAAVARMRAAARAIMAQPGTAGDLLGQLATARDPETGQPLPPDEVVDNILTFIGAGHETTALLLTWALSILAHLPQTQQALADEVARICGDGPVTPEALAQMDLHRRVLAETMRLYPPAAAIGREVVRDTELMGQTLRAGEHVTVAIHVIHRNSRYWDAPAVFDPDRFTRPPPHRFAWMPFGGGARICIGKSMAEMEAATLLACLMRRITVAPGPAAVQRPVMSVTLRPDPAIRLRVSARA